jgi:Carboxypeptidase regulatory-like domain
MPKVICPLHGIRTLAAWQRGLSDLLGRHGWICRLDRWSYGRFSILAFVTPWTREAKLGWLRRRYDAEMNDRRLTLAKGRTPSVVAHSFGTYILGYTLLRFDHIRFDKVILCGSILPPDFPWDRLIERGQVQAVRNEYGVRDPWVKRVRWFVRGTGPSGAVGFTCRHARLEQEEFDFDHSDYFGLDHMEDRWVPYLDRALPETPRAEAGPRIPRPKTAPPWGLYAAVLALALLAGAVGAYLYLASHRAAGMTGVSPAKSTTAKSALPPAPAAVLEGYVIDAETRAPLADVRLTIQDWKTRAGGSPMATTDAAGRFQFDDLRPSEDSMQQVRLSATKGGYETSTNDPPLGTIGYPIKLRPSIPPENGP